MTLSLLVPALKVVSLRKGYQRADDAAAVTGFTSDCEGLLNALDTLLPLASIKVGRTEIEQQRSLTCAIT